MRFLRRSDYYRLIQADELTTILSTAKDQGGYDPDQLLIDLENGAREEISSYLSARYDIDRIFGDLPVYDPTATYYGQQRVQYHEAAWSSATNYALGARVSNGGSIYESLVANNLNHATTDTTKWKFVCLDYAIFWVSLPYQEFQEFTNYAAGSQVWFKDNYTYTAKQNTQGHYLNDAVYSTYGADLRQPALDVNQTTFNADISNTTYWTKSGSKYSVSGVLPTDGTKWTAGDNRSALIIEHMIDIVLFKLFSAVVPRSIPELRILRYNGADVNSNGGAIGWLKKVAGGDISANLYEVYPQQGMPVVFGSGGPKMTNMY